MPSHEGLKTYPCMRAHAFSGSVRSTSPRRYELCSDLHFADDDCQSLYTVNSVNMKKTNYLNENNQSKHISQELY